MLACVLPGPPASSGTPPDACAGAQHWTSVAASAAAGPRRTTIPVYAHVLRDKQGGGIPQHRIRWQLAVMSRAYAGEQSRAAATSPFRFRLADVDVTVNGHWYRMEEGSVAERNAKNALHRGDASALNLYFANSRSGSLGWATRPGEYRQRPQMDGVVVQRRTLPGGSRGHYSAGDVAVHESGHWLGLLHTFAGRCGSRGDLVADTAPEARPSFTCPVHRNTCTAPGRDPVHNFMDYSDDACMDRFTAGQVSRMVRAWADFRA